MAIEELFFNTNVTTGIGVAQARGVILMTAAQLGVTVYEYTPSQVKQAVVGYGKAEKRQVMDMTRRLLHLAAVPLKCQIPQWHTPGRCQESAHSFLPSAAFGTHYSIGIRRGATRSPLFSRRRLQENPNAVPQGRIPPAVPSSIP